MTDAARHRGPSRVARASGFTLVETIIALVLSSIVLVLVSTTFLVQNQFYAGQAQMAGAHDNARTATELIANEVRAVKHLGITVAGRRTLAVRSALTVGVVCFAEGSAGGSADVLSDGGEAALDTDEVAGVALLDQSTGDWDYRNAAWATLNGSAASSAGNCYANGADTTAAYSEFHRLSNLSTIYGATPPVGAVLMLFRETRYTIESSALDSTTLALFRKSYAGSPVEFATGIDTTARFRYRVSGSYLDTVTAGSIASIDAIRIVADARKAAVTGGRSDFTFGWSADVAVPDP